jgi:hypothetical protein
MNLQLPQRVKPGNYSFNTDPATLTAWLNDLPLLNTERTRELLDGALQQVNALALPTQKRQKALELFTKPVICSTDALKKKFLNKPLPLNGNNLLYATQTLELLNQIATGYRVLAEDLRNNAAERPQLAIAIHRALRCLSEILLTCYQIYIQYPEGIWKVINLLYALADEYNITEQDVTDTTLKTPKPGNIETVYKQALLLSLACPYRLRQKEIYIAHSTLMEWASFSQLHHMDDDNTHGLFSINLQSDTPASYRVLGNEDAGNRHARILDTRSMAERIRNNLNTSHNTDTLQRLLLAWGAMPKRQFARQQQNAPVKLIIGLNAIHSLALGPTIDKPKTDENIRDKDYLQDPTFESTTKINTNKSTSNNTADGNNPFKGAYATDNITSSRVESWKIADISAGGYCLLWDSDGVSCAQVGELVALIEEEHLDPDKWQLGAIRRMKFTEERGLELGVQLLSPGATAVWARPCKDGINTGDKIQGILLPEIKAIKVQASLLLPSMPFRIDGSTTFEYNGNKETVKLTHQLENTGSFTQYHFTPL